jgi:hypothetical protein
MRVERELRRLWRTLGLLLLSAGAVAVSLAAVELLLRWNIIPNDYYDRHRIFGDSRQQGPFLLILGDSFMAPNGPLVATYLFPRLAAHGVRIRNTATSGSGPLRYLENLRAEGPRYRPDVVLVSYYVGNDLLDVGCHGSIDDRLGITPQTRASSKLYLTHFVRERLQKAFPGRLFLQSVMPEMSAVMGMTRWLLHWREGSSPDLSAGDDVHPAGGSGRPDNSPSAGLRFARFQDVDFEQMKRAGIPQEHIDAARTGEVNPWVVNLGVAYPDYFRDELLMRSACAQRAWADTKRVLDMLLDRADRLGADVFPVIFPHTLQVDTAHYRLYRAWQINVDSEMLTTHRPQDNLREYFRGRGIEPLDLLAPFRAQGERLYWDKDEHLNLRGVELSAKLISEAFVTRYGALRRGAWRVRPRLSRTGPPSIPVVLPLHIAPADRSARRWMQGGWGDSEGTAGDAFVWSRGAQSVLRVHLPSQVDIRMHFKVLPLDPGRGHTQRITVLLNDSLVDEVRVQAGLGNYSVRLPAGIRREPFSTLEFRYAFTRAPRDIVPGSVDERQLAVAWYSIEFTAEETGP